MLEILTQIPNVLEMEPSVEHGLAWIEHFDMIHAFGLFACSKVAHMIHTRHRAKIRAKKILDPNAVKWEELTDDVRE